MSRNLSSPVQIQMAIDVFSSPLNVECQGSTSGKQMASRRVFVQTETGCVLGMDLDRRDSAQTVKKRLQLALHVPTDESSLTIGDVTLKNDLSGIRNDSHLLLTRNTLQRSSSTPCLSPTGRNIQQKDQSGLIEILGHSSHSYRVEETVKSVLEAIKIGVDPIPVHSGLGGAYYFRNSIGENIAIVKPTDEEPFAPNNPKGFVGKALGQPGLKQSVRVGETGYREVAAFLLDYDHFANVPPTALVKITHSIFNVNDGVNGNKLQERRKVSKIASLQQYIPHDFDAGDCGTSSFPFTSVHRIGILDIRIFNTDRHAGNLLVRKLNGNGRFGQVELIPIDHGLCLPEGLEDPYFEWIHWPQASIPFSEDELEYIRNLDPFYDSNMLRSELPMIREASLRVLVLSTIFLQEAAAFGLCLAEIGEMMSREENRCQEDKPSELEMVCLEARMFVTDREIPLTEAEGEEEYLFDIEYESAADTYPMPKVSGSPFDEWELYDGCRAAATELKLSEVDGTFEGAGVKEGEEPIVNDPDRTAEKPPSGGIGRRQVCYFSKGKGSYSSTGSSANRRSVNEQLLLPTSISFVKLGDMNEEEWSIFLERFKVLLWPAIAERRSTTMRTQRSRLGTSCQF